MTASRLVHSYSAEQNRLDDSQESRTFASVNSPVQGRDYTNSVYSSWYSVGKGLQGYLSSKAVISVGTTSFTLSTYNNLDSFLLMREEEFIMCQCRKWIMWTAAFFHLLPVVRLQPATGS